VEVVVVREGRSGILGLGADEAVVRVIPIYQESFGSPGNIEELSETVNRVLERLLDLLGIDGSIMPHPVPVFEGEVEEGEGTGAPVSVNIEGDDLGILIGRRGQTLASLQYIVRLIVGHQRETWVPITIDVEGYKRRRYDGLQSFARQMAEQVKSREVPFNLEPMSAYERRLVHLILADDPEVTTESIGQGESRRVVILPSK